MKRIMIVEIHNVIIVIKIRPKIGLCIIQETAITNKESGIVIINAVIPMTYFPNTSRRGIIFNKEYKGENIK
jgi:hypothetical protein